MGREIRRVPVGWQHPKRVRLVYSRGEYVDREEFIPLYEDFSRSVREWDKDKVLWDEGTYAGRRSSSEETSWIDYAGERPDPDDYVPEFSEPCDGWCVYETVSEGTPVTPVFATPEELIEYLVEHGDFWDQKRRADTRRSRVKMNCDPWSREAATNLVLRDGRQPSFLVQNGTVKRSIDE